MVGAPLPPGGKPFVDDGNTYAPRAGIPALTHGPDAKGAHTTNEEVPVSELVRVAKVYALTAIGYCCEAAGEQGCRGARVQGRQGAGVQGRQGDKGAEVTRRRGDKA